MTTIDVEFEKVQNCDVVTLRFMGREFTGQAIPDKRGQLRVGESVLSRFDGSNSDLRFVRATRKVPELPTAPASAILHPVVDKETYTTAIRLGYKRWKCFRPDGSNVLFNPEQIEPGSWKLLYDAGAES